MSRPVNPIICDGCGKTKGEHNGWWTAYLNVPGLFRIAPGTEYSDEPMVDLCGTECVLRWVRSELTKYEESKIREQMGKQVQG